MKNYKNKLKKIDKKLQTSKISANCSIKKCKNNKLMKNRIKQLDKIE